MEFYQYIKSTVVEELLHMKTIPIIATFSLILIPLTTTISSKPTESKTVVATSVIDNLLARENYMRYGDQGLHYAEAVTVLGALRVAELNGDQDRIDQLVKRYELLLDPNTDLISKRAHVDFSVIGVIPLRIYRITGREDFLELGLRFADKQWEDPREDGLTKETRWWIDDIYMVGSLQMQAYRITGNEVYADRAARFMAAYLDKLQQSNGLFFHGPEAPFFWGRGNGWVAAGLAETLQSIPESHQLFERNKAGYLKMMQALLRYQSPSGMWRQLVDQETSWEESSCTAMFAFAMQVGIRKGWLEENVYSPAVKRAWVALLDHLDAEGNLEKICVGTGQSKDVQYYLDRPTHDGDFHGQAPFLWLATELYRY